MKKIFLCIAWLACIVIFGQVPQVSTGTIRRFEKFNSSFVEPRNIDVWLPDKYTPKEKYAVLYMHDGQMLFDATMSWNKQAWDVDDVAGKLQAEGTVKKFIVVGIWNNGSKRHPEYFPQKPFETLPANVKDSIYKMSRAANNNEAIKIQSDNYLRFIVQELKPFIDKNFSTRKDERNTFIAGSSMGGLISMYAICEYPEVFGGAACLSTHWPGTFSVEKNPVPKAFLEYFKANLPSPKRHVFYFDYGTETLDALYKPFQVQADAILTDGGYTEKNWLSREFIGDDHSENSWHKRLDIPLFFLLHK